VAYIPNRNDEGVIADTRGGLRHGGQHDQIDTMVVEQGIQMAP
jgi:hypothetical protein